jgi:hypothetical protein
LQFFSNGHFFFFVGKIKLLLTVFHEFLDERFGGSLHCPYGVVEKNLTASAFSASALACADPGDGDIRFAGALSHM